MEFNDLIFYVLDIAILVMLVRMLNASRRVELEVKAGSTLYVAIAFFLIALAGLLRYQGAFRWIQTAALVVMGVLYLFLKTGFSKTGIILFGQMYPYARIRNLRFNDEEHCLRFEDTKKVLLHGPQHFLYYPPAQEKQIRDYLSSFMK
jgi:hypothetical protein